MVIRVLLLLPLLLDLEPPGEYKAHVQTTCADQSTAAARTHQYTMTLVPSFSCVTFHCSCSSRSHSPSAFCTCSGGSGVAHQ